MQQNLFGMRLVCTARLAHMLNAEQFWIHYNYYTYWASFSASNNLYYYRYCDCPVGCPAHVCVRSFLPPRATRPRNTGTYVFTATQKTLLYIWGVPEQAPHLSYCCAKCIRAVLSWRLASNLAPRRTPLNAQCANVWPASKSSKVNNITLKITTFSFTL